MSRSALAAGVRHLRGILAAQYHRDESDEQLLHAFLDHHDDSAFAVLVRRHGPMVMGVCRRVLGHPQDAEDAFQATFLVLARNAAALCNKTALAGFLHGTAYRLALAAKRAAARRRKHERQAVVRTTHSPADEVSWREVQALLDEEIAHLPEKYQSVFVLCCLENVSRAEAARRLGLKEGTVSSRLAEARKRLQQRLSRRGVELTALLAAMALATETASALPIALLTKTIEGAVSPTVAALADSFSAVVGIGKIKLATVLLLAASVLSGASLWAYRGSAAPPTQPAEPPAAQANDKPKTAPPKRETAQTMEIQGRVLGPDGKPKAGAKLLLLGANEEIIKLGVKGTPVNPGVISIPDTNEKITELGVTAADGRFTVAVPKQAKGCRLIARTDDTGIDFVDAANLKPGKPVELRLMKDRPIRGRIINTEGKPVVGARVAVQNIKVYVNNSLDSFLIGWAKRRGNAEIPGSVKGLWPEGAAPFAATTDSEGRFVIRGVGAERVVLLHFSGPGIASTQRRVINRDGFDPKPYNQELRDYALQRVLWGPGTMLSGPDVSIVAEHEKIIRGVVKDADTDKGVAGVTVWLTASGDREDPYFGLLALPLKTRTDAAGRYEMRGARKMKSYVLQVVKNPALGYLSSQIQIDNTLGYQPVTADLKLKKGVIVTGRMIDKSTGKSVPGHVHTIVLNGNPFAKDYSIDNLYPRVFLRGELPETGKDGAFRDVVIPGPVLLSGNVDTTHLPGGVAEELGFKKSVPDPKYPEYFQRRPDGILCYFGLNGIPGAVAGHSCKVLDTKPGTAVVHQDLFVERDSARTVKIQDVEGRPLTRVWATGLRPDRYSQVRIKGDFCPVYALEANKSRLMVFYEPSKKLVGSLRLTADEKEPITAKLGPAGTIKGRLLDADGKPLAGIAVDLRYWDSEAQEIERIVHEGKQVVTDANGAFTLDDLIPQQKFELSFRRGRRRFEHQTKPADAAIQVKVGECRDLGALKLKPLPEKAGE